MRLEPRLTLLHLALDLDDRAVKLLAACNIVRRRIDRDVVDHALRHTRHGVDLGNALDLVAEEFDADRPPRPIDRVNLHRVAAHAEMIARKFEVVALVADLDKLFGQLVARLDHAGAQGDDHVLIVDRVAQAVDTRDGRHNDHVAPLEE